MGAIATCILNKILTVSVVMYLLKTEKCIVYGVSENVLLLFPVRHLLMSGSCVWQMV